MRELADYRIPMAQTPATSSANAQRRRHFRIPVRAGAGLVVHIWKIQPGVPISHKPMPSQELKVIVREVSEGGLSITIPSPMSLTHRPPTVTASDRLRVSITQAEHEILLEGRLRTVTPAPKSDGSIETGIQSFLRKSA